MQPSVFRNINGWAHLNLGAKWSSVWYIENAFEGLVAKR